MSVDHALSLSGIEVRLGRWWIKRFVDRGWLVELPNKLADVREVVPEHWRVTRRLMRQLRDRAACGELHCLVDARGPNIESAAKNIGEAEDVVHLIGEIGPPRANQGVRPRRGCGARLDFSARIRVRGAMTTR